MKRYATETLILVVAAVLCAVVANAMASRDRKLALVGNYGGATRASMSPDWVATHEAAPPAGIDEAGEAAAAEEVPVEVASTPANEPAAGGSTAPANPPAPAAEAAVQQRSEAPAAAVQSPAPAAAPAPARAASPQDVLKRFPPTPDKPFVEISGADAAWLHANGALFLDARRSSIFEQGHIAGARSVSVWESDVDDKVARLLEEGRDQKMPIVVYCSGGACEDSHMLSQKLWGVFFENVLVYKDGFPDWQQRGGAVRTGAAR